jgi:hypothetical protein
MHARRVSFGAIGAIAMIAGAGPIEMTIDPAQSSIDLAITVDVSIANDTDTDSSSLSGVLAVEFDDYGNPTEITLHDLSIMIDDDLMFNWSFGFFGSANASLVGGAVTWGSTDNVVGPVPVSSGDFVLPDVPVALAGTMFVDYDIFLVGEGSETISLADQGDFASTIDGSVAVSGETLTLTSTLPLDATTPLTDSSGTQLGTLTVVGTATIVATGSAPACPADLTGDGVLNFFDVSAFLNAYNAMDPIADFDNNGVFNFFDVSGFLNAFNAGCP